MTGQRKALIVASDEYEHEGLGHLLAPAADAAALATVLGDPQVGDFDVRVVRNEPSHVVEGQIEDLFAESRADDVLLLHFSCHGLKNDSGELFFAARNTRPNRLGSTAISADFVQRCMRASRSRSIVLLLDCCYGGAFGQGVTVRAGGDVNVLDSFPGAKLGGGRGRAVITASSAMEYAFEGDRLADDHSQRPSVFTSAVVEGLSTGDADRDEDGRVSLNELYDYVFDRVRERNPHQTPSRDVEMQGELYVARSRRRRIRALPIPPDLRAAITDPSMFARLGAVGELRTRLASDNLPAAAGAREALAEIVHSDIQYVADAAAAALGDAAIQPAERELHFGSVPQGSDPAHRTVRLLGLPLARSCTPRPSHDWIRVVEATDGLDVSVDTSQPGTRRGEIALTGPAGEAVITVDVEITAQPDELLPPPRAGRSPAPAPAPAAAPAPAPAPAAAPAQAAAGPPSVAEQPPRATDPAASPSIPPAGDRGYPSPFVFVGGLAVAGAVLLLVGLIPNYEPGNAPIAELGRFRSAWYWYASIVAALAGGAGGAMLRPRTKTWSEPVIGAGILLGIAAASIWGFAFLVNDGLHRNVAAGFGLELAAHVLLVLAAGLTGARLAGAAGVRLGPARLDRFAWSVVLLGVAGAAALAFHDQELLDYGDPFLLAPAICATVLAFVLPVCAVVVSPRRLGVSLLAGWIGGGAAIVLYYRGVDASIDYNPLLAFGGTLLALLLVAVPFARATPTPAPPGR